MEIKYPNLYFLFFSIACSAAFFPSMLSNYTGYRIPVGFAHLVLDELILLLCLFFAAVTIVKNFKISAKVVGYGIYILIFAFLIFSLTVLSFYREEARIDIILRDRWIFLNILVVFLPIVHKLNIEDLATLSRHFVQFMAILTSLKICYLVVNGSDGQFASFSPDFTYMLGISSVLLIFSRRSVFIKIIFACVSLLVAFISQQLSGILFMFGCIILPVIYMNFKRNFSLIFMISTFSFLFFILFIYLDSLISNLGLSLANFTIMEKIIVYLDMWRTSFVDVTLTELLFGRGAGYVMSVEVYREFYGTYTVVQHSLAHNIFVTLLMKFGIVGIFPFLLIVGVIFFPSANRFSFTNSIVLKIILVLILFNFLSTPGVWKIRKGIFLWFTIGSLYAFRQYSKK